jgi:hypothetical protein
MFSVPGSVAADWFISNVGRNSLNVPVRLYSISGGGFQENFLGHFEFSGKHETITTRDRVPLSAV